MRGIPDPARRLVVPGLVFGIALAMRCGDDTAARPAGASSPQAAEPATRADAETAREVLRRSRGVDPLLCSLALRSISRGSGHRLRPGVEDDPELVALVEWVASRHEDPGVVEALAGGLRDGDPCVRRMAALQLGRSPTPPALDALTRALGSEAAPTREVAAIGLGVADAESSVPALARRLSEDEDPRVRRAAAWALGEIDS